MSNRKKLPHGFNDEQWFNDQLVAAAADARRQTMSQAGPSGVAFESGVPGELPLAERLGRMAQNQLGRPGNLTCGHFKPRSIEPMHWFPIRPDRWFCGRCAKPVITKYEAVADWCDLCDRGYLHDELTVIHATVAVFSIHAALCAGHLLEMA